jgi:HAMP domain-containing protein
MKPEKPGMLAWTKEARMNAFGDMDDLDDFHTDGLGMFDLKPAREVHHPFLKVAAVLALVLISTMVALGYLTGGIGNLEPLGPLIGAGQPSATTPEEDTGPVLPVVPPEYADLRVVALKELNIHEYPNEESNIWSTLAIGSVASVAGATVAGPCAEPPEGQEQCNWVPVYKQDMHGYLLEHEVEVYTDTGEEAHLSAVGTATTTAASNFRRGPSTGDAVIRVLPRGTSVNVTGEVQGGWVPVEHNGDNGYISAQILEID